jgi:hypothetical protein
MHGLVVQRATYDTFGHPFPEAKEEAEFKKDPAKWQHDKLQKSPRDFIVGVLSQVGGQVLTDAMQTNESTAKNLIARGATTMCMKALLSRATLAM